MTLHTFIVEVDVERDQGLFAPRDEISDKIIEALDEAENSIDLTGLGAQGNSDYSVSSFVTEAVDTSHKEGRDRLMEYDAQVVAELPGDAQLRADNKRLRAELKELNKVLDSVKDRNIKLQEQQDERQAQERTRIWYADAVARRSDYKSYIPDGKHDLVFFQYGERDDETLAFEFQEDGSIEVRNQGWTQLTVVPQSSNVIVLKMAAR